MKTVTISEHMFLDLLHDSNWKYEAYEKEFIRVFHRFHGQDVKIKEVTE